MNSLEDDERKQLVHQAHDAQIRLTKLEAEIEIARLKRLEIRRRKVAIAMRKLRKRRKEQAQAIGKALAAGQREQGHLFASLYNCPSCLEALHKEAHRQSISVETLLARVIEPRVKARAN